MTHLQIRPFCSENETWTNVSLSVSNRTHTLLIQAVQLHICLRIHHDEDYTQQDVTGTSAVEIPLPKFPMQHDDLAYQKKKNNNNVSIA